MSAQIIPFEMVRSRAQSAAAPIQSVATPAKKPKSERRQRFEDWTDADARTNYWNSYREYLWAAERMHRRVPDLARAMKLPNVAHEEDTEILQKYSSALYAQVCTPAYNMVTLGWKKRQIASGFFQYHCSVAGFEHIKELIAEDEAWLHANMRSDYKRKHPVT